MGTGLVGALSVMRSNTIFRRTDFGASGKPVRKVTMSYCESPGGSLISKTVKDQHDTSIACGGSARDYSVSFRPGHSIDLHG